MLTTFSACHSLWDVADDAFFAKQNPCCPALHFEAMPRMSPAGWTILYVVVSLLVFVGFILAALAAWKQSPHAMYCQVSRPRSYPASRQLPECGFLSRARRRSRFYRECNTLQSASLFRRSVFT